MQGFRVLFLWIQGTSPSQQTDVFTSQEAHLSLGGQSCYWGFILKA